MFINYAHRGASEYAPENTLSSFYLGLSMGANGIETDVQRTKDGILVLFHDDTLDRVTGVSGKISDYTYAELTKFRVKNAKTGKEDIITTMEDFLKYFGFRDLTFAIELKEAGTEADVLTLLDKYAMREKTVITSFNFSCIETVKKLRSDYKVGWLAVEFDEEKLAKMRAIGGEELCPKAEHLTPEQVKAWHEMGYNVRAWGVANTDIMKHAYLCGVDGMTVNFPDLLVKYKAENP